ncbi:hypothetical protein [Chishuiella sp.]|uniref:hypothetical protein n=1 Tax=Chishuiella sp. TaxID=1969467 RepID=UPI0028AC1D39|nr:hypothetical protein [Chishuiella sp.]
MKQNAIIFPKEYLPGATDNFCSNELIVKNISIEKVWKNLINPFLWPLYYKNSSDINFKNKEDRELYLNVIFNFKTFGFPISAKVIEFDPPENNQPARLAWHGWSEGNEESKIDVHHAWLIENLSDNRLRILTQETQNGNPAKELAQTKPNPMINGHQDWLDGLINFSKK